MDIFESWSIDTNDDAELALTEEERKAIELIKAKGLEGYL